MQNKLKNNLLVAVASLITALSVNAQEINFADAWTLLQEKNNSLAAQRANVQRYQQLQEADHALNLPSLKLTGNYTRLDDDVTVSGDLLTSKAEFDKLLPYLVSVEAARPAVKSAISEMTSTVTEKDIFKSSLRAMWAIYTGGRISAAQDYSAARLAEATAQLDMETQERFEDLSKYYFSVVLAQQVLDTRKSVEKGLTQHRDSALKLEQQGQIAKVERLQAEASLAQAVVDRKKSQMDLEIVSSALTEILNQPAKVTPQSSLFINKTLPPLGAFTEQTLATYPGLDILNAKKQQAASSIKAEKGKYHPEVFLYGDYTLYEGDSLAAETAPGWFAGIGVNVPIFDNTGRSEKVDAAQSAMLEVRHLHLQAQQDLTVLVKKTYFGAQQAIEEVQGLQASLALAEENLKLRKKAFSQGLSTSLDVVDAELYLASIKNQQQVASFNYITSLNKLLSLSSQMSAFNKYELSAFQSIKFEDK